MKFHRLLLVAVVDALREVLLNDKQADHTLDKMFAAHKNWGARDRHFIADNTYHILRYKRLFEYCATAEEKNALSLWKMLGAKLVIDGHQLPGYDEFKTLVPTDILLKKQEAQYIRKIRESIPNWLDTMGEEQLGEQWEKEVITLNQPAKLSLRVNTLKCTKADLKQALQKEGIETSEVPNAPDALVIEGRKNLRNLAAYKNGWFEMQDVSSQLVAPLLDVKEGMKVIDACSGGGGKTLHIAALMNNRGSIRAMDINDHKLEEVKLRAKRNGVRIVSEKNIDLEYIPSLKESADRLLLDVPCSGTGVLRRKPDAKWHLTAEFITKVTQTQLMILDEYSVMVKKNGVMVYSTCSILPIENERQVKAFLARHKDQFELLEEMKVSPADSGFDGFYAAKLLRKA
jgi:16S rRNA (cytosine967-C5)-methyltransferase